MIHLALVMAKTVFERTSLGSFYSFWQQRKLVSSGALGRISICKPSAAGFALIKIKMQKRNPREGMSQ